MKLISSQWIEPQNGGKSNLGCFKLFPVVSSWINMIQDALMKTNNNFGKSKHCLRNGSKGKLMQGWKDKVIQNSQDTFDSEATYFNRRKSESNPGNTFRKSGNINNRQQNK